LSNKNNNNRILKVAIPVALIDCFDYSAVDNLPKNPIGCRVLVPFNNRQLIAVVIATSSTSKYKDTLKPIIKFLDDSPFFSSDLLKLSKWANDYYAYFYGMTLNQIMPGFYRQGKDESQLWQTIYYVNKTTKTLPAKAHKMQQVLNLISQNPTTGISHNNLIQNIKSCTAILKKLKEQNFIKSDACLPVIQKSKITDFAKKLNPEQQVIYDNIQQDLNNFTVHLIDGITGSGKTEIYLQLIDKILQQQKQVLILVPEIGLTPQLVQRFSSRFATEIITMHSGLNQTIRATGYLQTKQNKAKIIIGTRSAIWCQFKNLGMIIVDEEHDSSFKQQSKFLYHARDLSVVIAKNNNIPIILGSATSSMESYLNCQSKKYNYHLLKTRATKTLPPRVTISALNNLKLYEGFASSTLTKICEHLRQNNQVLIYINRRGFAPKYMCFECGEIKTCRHCSATMTYHKAINRLRCHFCNALADIKDICEKCGSHNIGVVGLGSEKIDNVINDSYPAYKSVRVDRDTTANKGQLEQKLNQITTGDCKILIGTQMLAKGHHFPKLSLVVIMDADRGLFGTDFRSIEHMSQEIIQVAGRSGREGKQGEVLIQTMQPKNQIWDQLFGSSYFDLIYSYIKIRTQHSLPPITSQILIRAKSKNAKFADNFLEIFKNNIPHDLKQQIRILGPAPAPMEKIANLYRFNLVILCHKNISLASFKKWVLHYMANNKYAKKLSWSIDVDAVNS